MPVSRTETKTDRQTLSIETGNWAKQAHGAVVFRTGKLTLLATVCAEKEPREGQDFFPLTVDYREKFYAAGRIPGGYFKREQRPAEHETLISRLIDRPVRPLFPEGYLSEVQLLITQLSADADCSVEGHAITAASAALMASDIPFHGPIAGVVVGRINGQFVADPSLKEKEASDLELVVAGSQDAITMIEGGCREFTNEEMISALEFAHQRIRERLKFQEELARNNGAAKREVIVHKPDQTLMTAVRDYAFAKLESANRNSDKMGRSEGISAVYKETVKHFQEKLASENFVGLDRAVKDIKKFLHELEYEVVRNNLFQTGKRADGRRADEIRDISIELDVLPGAHGSAVFTRGQTQSLGVVTLGTAADNQRYETLAGQQIRTFMLHYNFPPYSTGEVKRMMGPGRREIGHGNLAFRGLREVLPDQKEFPYVTRIVSEILESNGSSSMATVCSGSLAMMAAGVPVRAAVSGIAMGMFSDQASGKHAILYDIAGIEDHFGDMDFKVTGTRKGITAFQLDLKLTGISIELLREALGEAEKGRLHIMDKMDAAISKPRDSLSPMAPRITQIRIDPDRIGELIGPGGKIIRAIIEKTGAEISVEDDGVVSISSASGEANDHARRMVEDIFRDIQEGDEYNGIVKRLVDFGAFIEIFPGREGLLHISKMSLERVRAVSDVMKEGDIVPVIVAGVDRTGRIDLAHKDVGLGGRPRGDRGGEHGDRGDRGRPERGGRGHSDRGGGGRGHGDHRRGRSDRGRHS
ncbi:MAG: polyribonucleotide nucleotidyltransferase [Leptospirales bacterium]|nr:polyribonucleotide nucleotidyltransferase [Leptospirales bacterium]